MQWPVFFVVLILMEGGVVVQGFLAWQNKFLTREQMFVERSIKDGDSFFQHGGMWADVVVISPVVAYIAAALGYFNIFAVLLLSILGDLAGDFIYYGIGYFGRVAFVERYGHKVGLTKERMERMEELIKEHPTKTMTAIKLAPAIPGPGLMMVGATKMPFGKYTWITFIVTLPKAILFMALGYYFGRAYDGIAHYLQNGEYFIVIALVIVVLAYFIYKKISAVISARLETV